MMNVYTIEAAIKEEVEKKLESLNRKASKLNCEKVKYFFSEPYALERTYSTLSGIISKYMVEVVDVTIESEMIQLNGYEVVAMLEHDNEHGRNVVKMVNWDEEPKSEWMTKKCFCEHCKQKRARVKTFILKNNEGKEIQVGRSCLKDFAGIDPQEIGWLNAFEDYLEEKEFNESDCSNMNPARFVYDTVDMMALAIHLVNTKGYTKSDEIGSNKSEIIDKIQSAKDIATEEEYKAAKEMIKALKAMDNDETFRSNLNNIKALVMSDYQKLSRAGYFAYAPVAFAKYVEKIEEKNCRLNAESKSEWVGSVGQRIMIELEKSEVVTSWETLYGTTFLRKMIDVNGNVIIWFASNARELGKKIKATVKEHSERDGVKQTIVTRCTAA